MNILRKLTNLIVLSLWPDAIIEKQSNPQITKRDFWRLLLGNYIIFSILTVLIVLTELFILHNFDTREILPFIITDIVLAIISAFLEYRWIKFRQRDKEHFAQYKKNTNTEYNS